MEERLFLPPIHPTYFYIDTFKVDVEIDLEDFREDLESLTNIAIFLRMSQEVISKGYDRRAEPLIDYSQSQILTLYGHIDTLYSIQRKKQLAEEKEAKRIEKELTKITRAQKKQ